MRIAILGGTFDPIHNGHLTLARSVLQAFDIDECHFVPAFSPPHKPRTEITSPFHRFAMVALATASDERFRVSSVEADTLEPRYSVDTLDLMHQLYPESRFLFIIGTDLYREIEEWKAYTRLFDLADIAVVHRPGFPMREDAAPFETLDRPARTSPEGKPGVYYLPWVRLEESSTHIRGAAGRGEPLDAWVPAEVAHYIQRHRLYQPAR